MDALGRIKKISKTAGIFVFLMSTLAANSEDAPNYERTWDQSRFSLGVGAGASFINLNSNQLSGADLSLWFRYAVFDRWGVGVQLMQTLASAPLASSLRSNVEPTLTLAITGLLKRTDYQDSIDSRKFFAVRGRDPSGFRLGVFLIQSFFSSGESTVSLTGLGASTYYEFPAVWLGLQPVMGARAELQRNTDNTVKSFGFFVGAAISP